jgi:hypothetical protein
LGPPWISLAQNGTAKKNPVVKYCIGIVLGLVVGLIFGFIFHTQQFQVGEYGAALITAINTVSLLVKALKSAGSEKQEFQWDKRAYPQNVSFSKISCHESGSTRLDALPNQEAYHIHFCGQCGLTRPSCRGTNVKAGNTSSGPFSPLPGYGQ